ncbi:phosphoesterase [Mycoplasmopsis californica]|uniref:Phosphoesterase n=1 Tax=Mycoplasmopsis equigenitalium TaxID=114883 RepID=A0ABY5J5N3_9BACT|nr:YfcE family phosphodiesterase [Mycoplasmopsis equigenitalium]UUD36998.1 YfcE family phosphodiesterase [Mycoplasmopsis equigenitalium]VEU69704.1 phosphoesterase [Mycoplasmopsis californica]
MIKILVVSDIHGNYGVVEDIVSRAKYDVAICTGDYEVGYDFMKEHFDFFVVGNNDFDYHAADYEIEIEGLKIRIEHGHRIGSYTQLMDVDFMFNHLEKINVDILLTGHTHVPLHSIRNNKGILNPGSCSYPRMGTKAGYAILTLDNKKIIRIEQFNI